MAQTGNHKSHLNQKRDLSVVRLVILQMYISGFLSEALDPFIVLENSEGKCIDSPEPSLFAFVIRTIFTRAGCTVHFIQTATFYFFNILLSLRISGADCKLLRWQMGRVKRIWYLSPVRAAKVQASLHIRAVSPEPPLLAHTSSESRGTFRQKARSLAPLNGWACVVTVCHDGMLEDTNSLDAAQMVARMHKAGMKTWFEPHHEKTCLWGLRPVKNQTGLCSHRD